MHRVTCYGPHYNGFMVASMTAFGRAGGDLVEWEIRSVNHRYLEMSFRLPEPFRELEGPLRGVVAQRIRRGRLDATLRFAGQASVAPRLNPLAIDKLLGVVNDIRDRVPSTGPLDPVEILRFPGVVQDDPENLADFKVAALDSFVHAIDDLVAHRDSEGANLETLLRERLAALEHTVARVRALAADQAVALRDRLRRRVLELTERVDAERLDQEIALLAQKSDVAEELDRLDIHVAQARGSLDGDEPCGRRLDFLMQELSREANTLAAKSVLPEAAHLGVDLKVLIEQMREQVQNVE